MFAIVQRKRIPRDRIAGTGERQVNISGDLDMRLLRHTICTAALLAGCSAASAEELRAPEAISVRFGSFSGIAYYHVEPRGYRVVVTLASEENPRPIRIETVLAPAQEIVLSGGVDDRSAPPTIIISRRGDVVTLEGPVPSQ
jgi:hypothetical protein